MPCQGVRLSFYCRWRRCLCLTERVTRNVKYGLPLSSQALNLIPSPHFAPCLHKSVIMPVPKHLSGKLLCEFMSVFGPVAQSCKPVVLLNGERGERSTFFSSDHRSDSAVWDAECSHRFKLRQCVLNAGVCLSIVSASREECSQINDCRATQGELGFFIIACV